MLKTKVFSFGVFIRPPYVNDLTPNSAYPGIDVEIAELFCKYANFVCNFTETKSDAIDAAVDQLTGENSFDSLLPVRMTTENHPSTLTYSKTVRETEMLLLTRQPEKADNLSVLASLVFHWSVWTCLICISLVIGFVVANCRQRHTNAYHSSLSVATSSMYYESLITSIDIFSFHSDQTSLHRVQEFGLRILLGFWGFGTVIILGVYSSSLMSSLIRNTSIVPFDSFETFIDCLRQRRCTLSLTPADMMNPQVVQIFQQNQTSFEKFQRVLRENRDDALSMQRQSRPEIMEDIIKIKHRYIVTLKPFENFMVETARNKNCHFYSVPFAQRPKGFVMRAQRRLTVIDDFVLQYHSSGLYEKLYNKYIGREAFCQRPEIVMEMKPINVISFFSCVIILIFGLLFSVGVFGLEIANGDRLSVGLYLLFNRIRNRKF